jgi:hypothetical protein
MGVEQYYDALGIPAGSDLAEITRAWDHLDMNYAEGLVDYEKYPDLRTLHLQAGHAHEMLRKYHLHKKPDSLARRVYKEAQKRPALISAGIILPGAVAAYLGAEAFGGAETQRIIAEAARGVIFGAATVSVLLAKYVCDSYQPKPDISEALREK